MTLFDTACDRFDDWVDKDLERAANTLRQITATVWFALAVLVGTVSDSLLLALAVFVVCAVITLLSIAVCVVEEDLES